MAANESTLTVDLELLGRTLKREIKSWEIASDFLTVTDGFSFTCYAKDLALVRGLEMQPVELKVDGTQQCLGRIELSRIGQDGSAVSYEGRDYLADLVECAVDPSIRITEEMRLDEAIIQITKPVGIAKVVSDAGELKSLRTGRPHQKKPSKKKTTNPGNILIPYGEVQMASVQRLAAMQGLTVQPATTRDTLLLSAPDYDQATSYRIQRLLGKESGNNVIHGTVTKDFSRFPTYSIFNGSHVQPAKPALPTSAHIGIGIETELALSGGAFGVSDLASSIAASLFSGVKIGERQGKKQPKTSDKNYDTASVATGFAPKAEAIILGACHIGRQIETGDPLKMYRLMAVRDDTSRDQAQLERAAARTLGERLKELLVYQVDVQGHTDPKTGAIWSVDTMVDVVDEVCDIAEPLWIASRILKFDHNGGATTSLTCWRPGAFIT